MSSEDRKPGFFVRFIKSLFSIVIAVLVVFVVMVPIFVAVVYYSSPMDEIGDLGEITAGEFVKGKLAEMELAVANGEYDEDCYANAKTVPFSAALQVTSFMLNVRFPDNALSKQIPYEDKVINNLLDMCPMEEWENDIKGWANAFKFTIYNGIIRHPVNACHFPP